MPQCKYCGAFYPTVAAMRRHQSHSRLCRRARDNAWGNLLDSNFTGEDHVDGAGAQHGGHTGSDAALGDSFSQGDDGTTPDLDDTRMGTSTGPSDMRPSQRARVEDVLDEDWSGQLWSEHAPSHLRAGHRIGQGLCSFEEIRDEQVLRGSDIWGPFASEDEWDLAKWLIKNVGQNQAEKFLKLNMVSTRSIGWWHYMRLGPRSPAIQIRSELRPSFRNKTEFLRAIDQLPSGVDWQCESITLTGDMVDDSEEETPPTEDLELWFRDPVECIRELLGNPVFKDCMQYAPERLYTDESGENRVIDECWTGNWWWDVQVSSS